MKEFVFQTSKHDPRKALRFPAPHLRLSHSYCISNSNCNEMKVFALEKSDWTCLTFSGIMLLRHNWIWYLHLLKSKMHGILQTTWTTRLISILSQKSRNFDTNCFLKIFSPPKSSTNHPVTPSPSRSSLIQSRNYCNIKFEVGLSGHLLRGKIFFSLGPSKFATRVAYSAKRKRLKVNRQLEQITDHIHTP